MTRATVTPRPLDLALQSAASDEDDKKTNMDNKNQLKEYEELTDLYNDFVDR